MEVGDIRIIKFFVAILIMLVSNCLLCCQPLISFNRSSASYRYVGVQHINYKQNISCILKFYNMLYQ